MFFFIKKNRHSNVLHGIVNSPDAQNASWLPGCGWSHIAVKHSTGGGKSQGETCFLFGKPVISIKNTNPVSRTGIWAVSLVSDPVLILADHCIKMFFQSGAAENIAFHVNHFYRAAPFTVGCNIKCERTRTHPTGCGTVLSHLFFYTTTGPGNQVGRIPP